MQIHKCVLEDEILYTFFDAEERVVHYPTRYLERLRRDGRPVESQKQIANVIKLFCEWLEKAPLFRGLTVDERLTVAVSDDVIDWINDQRNSGKAENTINNREILVKGMYKWFATDEASICKDIPWFARNYTRQINNKLPRFLTSEQVIKLLLGLHNESQRAAIHFMFDTGVRISELLRITRQSLPNPSHYPEESNYYPLRVPGSKSSDSNTFKMRDTIISRPMLARIHRYHSTKEYRLAKGWKMFDLNKPVFLNVHQSPLSKQSIYNSIKAAWERQGENPDEIYPHRLRHGAAYSVLKSEYGVELLDKLLILRGMLGHTSIKTTEIYSSIPIAVIQSLSDQENIKFRFEEADQIYQATYLPEHKNIQKRGRKNDK